MNVLFVKLTTQSNLIDHLIIDYLPIHHDHILVRIAFERDMHCWVDF